MVGNRLKPTILYVFSSCPWDGSVRVIMIDKFFICFAGKKYLPTSLLALASMFLAAANVDARLSEKRIIVGGVENVRISEINAIVKAKLDTGAKTSSVNSKIIEQTDEYVVFEIISRDEGTSNIKLKKKIERFVRIKRKNSNHGGDDLDEKTIRRPVVTMEFCIAGQLVECEVNLANRSNFNHDLLIGRNMLEKGQLIVDVSKSLTTNPNCIIED